MGQNKFQRQSTKLMWDGIACLYDFNWMTSWFDGVKNFQYINQHCCYYYYCQGYYCYCWMYCVDVVSRKRQSRGCPSILPARSGQFDRLAQTTRQQLTWEYSTIPSESVGGYAKQKSPSRIVSGSCFLLRREFVEVMRNLLAEWFWIGNAVKFDFDRGVCGVWVRNPRFAGPALMILEAAEIASSWDNLVRAIRSTNSGYVCMLRALDRFNIAGMDVRLWRCGQSVRLRLTTARGLLLVKSVSNSHPK